jgi:hypothetical protein
MRPEEEDSPWLNDRMWDLAERCWDKDCRARPSALQVHDILAKQPEPTAIIDTNEEEAQIPEEEAGAENSGTALNDIMVGGTDEIPATTAATVATAPGGDDGSKLKPGESILNQIGEPDHVGWMQMKDGPYNNWKLRSFVLKGPEFYCLRSSNKAVRGFIFELGLDH